MTAFGTATVGGEINLGPFDGVGGGDPEGLAGWLTSAGGREGGVSPAPRRPFPCHWVRNSTWRSMHRIRASMSRHDAFHRPTSPSSSSILLRCLLRLAAALSRLRFRRCSLRHAISASFDMDATAGGA